MGHNRIRSINFHRNVEHKKLPIPETHGYGETSKEEEKEMTVQVCSKMEIRAIY